MYMYICTTKLNTNMIAQMAKCEHGMIKHKDEKLHCELTKLRRENQERMEQIIALTEQLQISRQNMTPQQEELVWRDRELGKNSKIDQSYPQRKSTLQSNIYATNRKIKLLLKESIDIPEKIAQSKAAVIGDKVYMKSRDSNVILEYDTVSQIWTKIGNHPLSGGFSLVNIDNVLTTVGGDERYHHSDKLLSYIPKLKQWVEILPRMLVKRHSPAVVYTNKHLVIIGGDEPCMHQDFVGFRIEVFDTEAFQWHDVVLLKAFSSVTSKSLAVSSTGRCIFTPESPDQKLKHTYKINSAVLCESFIYVNILKTVGTTTQIVTYSCSARDLLENIEDVWQREVSIETQFFSVAINGHMLGAHEGQHTGQHVTEYSPTDYKSETIAEMSTQRYDCTAAILPNNRLMIAGLETNEKCSADIFTFT